MQPQNAHLQLWINLMEDKLTRIESVAIRLPESMFSASINKEDVLWLCAELRRQQELNEKEHDKWMVAHEKSEVEGMKWMDRANELKDILEEWAPSEGQWNDDEMGGCLTCSAYNPENIYGGIPVAEHEEVCLYRKSRELIETFILPKLSGYI